MSANASNEGFPVNVDLLPEGSRDPMLMSISEIEVMIEEMRGAKNQRAEDFLQGVLFSRVSLAAAGISV